MKFMLYMDVLSAVVNMPTGATAGMVAKELAKEGRGVSKAQAQRALEELTESGMLYATYQKYRSNINRKLYVASEDCAILLSSIARDYMENERQIGIFETKAS